ncbi:MAG: hypothetical protein CVU65_18415 [Deltaproteobacteria bacterium HGW-Deltaproteobacteria-22]|nr:MAG: hypothetical protein CVU65_18415 [Deltaproteobacteria bacterium HGW-Deltaproteobacteria-22]
MVWILPTPQATEECPMKKVISPVVVAIWLSWAAAAAAQLPPPPAAAPKPAVPPAAVPGVAPAVPPSAVPEAAPKPDTTPAEAVAPGTTDDATPVSGLPSPPAPVVPAPAHTENSSGYISLRNVKVDGQAFLFYGATFDKDGKHQANTYGLSRGLLNFHFNPADNLAFRFSTDVVAWADPGTLPELESGGALMFKYAWVELKEVIPKAEKISIFAGLVDNVWNSHAETTSGLRWVMRPPITRYGFAPESDLGLWLRGELVEGLRASIGVSNGTGAFGADTDRTKAFDLALFHQLKDPLNLGLAAYVRWSLDRSALITDQDKNVHSLTGGFNATIRDENFRAGADYLFHVINDFTTNGAGDLDTYRHTYHVFSIYGVVTPIKEISAFLRLDAVACTTKWLETYSHSGQTLLAGVAYHFNKHFSISLDFSASRWRWDPDDPNTRIPVSTGPSYTYTRPMDVGLFMEGTKAVFVHSEWKF